MSIKVICRNRKARHDYHIEATFEAGIALKGSEVKSLRQGRGNLKDGYAGIRGGEAFLYNVHISPYAQASRDNPDPVRERKLLLHKKEIKRLIGKIQERGYTLIPLQMYFKNGKAKVELGLARGKKLYDKRETLRRKAMEREVKKAFKQRE
jgi:SsrA-binding protein